MDYTLREYIHLSDMKNDTPPPTLLCLKLYLCEYTFMKKQSTLWVLTTSQKVQ